MSGRASSAGPRSERLADRRRRNRRRALVAFAILLIFTFAGIVYGLHRPAVRISHVTIYGADQALADIARSAMQGSYFGIIPKDSYFFVPKGEIRSRILSAHQDMAAVSIFRNGLTGLSIKVDYRVPVARWCGAAPKLAPSDASNGCYLFDANGYVYGLSDPDAAPLNAALLYEPGPSAGSIIGSTLPSAEALPSLFDFARQFASFGSPAVSVAIRGDEVDIHVKSGTRITYVLGQEQDTFAALASARANLNLADGSVEYVDLRFPGKVYLKRLPK